MFIFFKGCGWNLVNSAIYITLRVKLVIRSLRPLSWLVFKFFFIKTHFIVTLLIFFWLLWRLLFIIRFYWTRLIRLILWFLILRVFIIFLFFLGFAFTFDILKHWFLFRILRMFNLWRLLNVTLIIFLFNLTILFTLINLLLFWAITFTKSVNLWFTLFATMLHLFGFLFRILCWHTILISLFCLIVFLLTLAYIWLFTWFDLWFLFKNFNLWWGFDTIFFHFIFF